jgi:hypothetical protein
MKEKTRRGLGLHTFVQQTEYIHGDLCHRYNVMVMQGLTNPLARRPGLVISTFGLAEIISCMPDGLVKIYIGY